MSLQAASAEDSALNIFHDMCAAAAEPDVVSYNALIKVTGAFNLGANASGVFLLFVLAAITTKIPQARDNPLPSCTLHQDERRPCNFYAYMIIYMGLYRHVIVYNSL